MPPRRPERPRSPSRAPAPRAPAPRAPAPGTVVVAPPAEAGLVRGHPWLWRGGVASGGDGLEPGAVVELRARDGRFLARALWDPGSPIVARVVTRDAGERVDASLFAARLEQAIARRARLVDPAATDALRLCHGEGDRAPGLVVDRYAEWAVVRTDGAAIDAWVERIAPALWGVLRAHGVRGVARRLARGERGEGDARTEPLAGEPLPERVVVREHGMRMEVDLARGQKTGAFLDQRDNRALVRRLAGGRRVLNLFSYAGGFSLAAALGGATEVTSVDVAAAAHATAQRSFRANDLDPGRHAWVAADAFAWLEQARDRGQRWDLVVSDPPSFAPSEKAKGRAVASYRRLHGLCASVLAPGGSLCAASCSSHVSPEDFLATLDDAALGRSDLVVQDVRGAGADHPVLAAFPEGRYLKLVVMG